MVPPAQRCRRVHVHAHSYPKASFEDECWGLTGRRRRRLSLCGHASREPRHARRTASDSAAICSDQEVLGSTWIIQVPSWMLMCSWFGFKRHSPPHTPTSGKEAWRRFSQCLKGKEVWRHGTCHLCLNRTATDRVQGLGFRVQVSGFS